MWASATKTRTAEEICINFSSLLERLKIIDRAQLDMLDDSIFDAFDSIVRPSWIVI